jgi:hypothetical protein
MQKTGLKKRPVFPFSPQFSEKVKMARFTPQNDHV